MHYTLMHKEIPVVDIELDDASGAITRVDDVHNAAHIHSRHCVQERHSRTARHLTNGGMGVPFRQVVKASNKRSLFCRIGSTQELIDKSYGLSLADRYWIQGRKVPRWNRLRSIFSQNDFSRDIGDILF